MAEFHAYCVRNREPRAEGVAPPKDPSTYIKTVPPTAAPLSVSHAASRFTSESAAETVPNAVPAPLEEHARRRVDNPTSSDTQSESEPAKPAEPDSHHSESSQLSHHSHSHHSQHHHQHHHHAHSHSHHHEHTACLLESVAEQEPDGFMSKRSKPEDVSL